MILPQRPVVIPYAPLTPRVSTRMPVSITCVRPVDCTPPTGKNPHRPPPTLAFPSAISLDAAEFFLGLPLGVVIDLRDPDEIDTNPKIFWDAGFSVVERPIFSGSIASMTTGVPGVEQLYLTMLERFPVQLAAAVGDVANSVEGGAVLVHCTAGKDRTGMVIALIQSLLGARDDDVIATYARTQANLSGEWLIGMHAKLRQLAQRDAQFAQLNVSDLDPLLAGSPARSNAFGARLD